MGSPHRHPRHPVDAMSTAGDLLEVLHELDEPERRRAGDFTWLEAHAGDASCVRCRRTETLARLRIVCRVHYPLPDDPTCLTQFTTAATVGYYAARVIAGTSPRKYLTEAIEEAQRARVDVGAVLADYPDLDRGALS